jgi:hypothetical protein
VVQRYGEYTYRQGEMRGIVGEERIGKKMDGCPLTLPPLQSMVSQHMKTARRLPGPS